MCVALLILLCGALPAHAADSPYGGFVGPLPPEERSTVVERPVELALGSVSLLVGGIATVVGTVDLATGAGLHREATFDRPDLTPVQFEARRDDGDRLLRRGGVEVAIGVPLVALGVHAIVRSLTTRRDRRRPTVDHDARGVRATGD